VRWPINFLRLNLQSSADDDDDDNGGDGDDDDDDDDDDGGVGNDDDDDGGGGGGDDGGGDDGCGCGGDVDNDDDHDDDDDDDDDLVHEPLLATSCFSIFNPLNSIHIAVPRLSTNDITSLVDDMYNFMSLNSSDPTSAFQSLTTTMRVLQAVVQSISNYALAASVKPSRLLLDSSNHAANTHSSGMSLRLSDGSGAEELFQAWRAVLNTLLRIHNRLEGWPLQQVGTENGFESSCCNASAASEGRADAVVILYQQPRVSQHSETAPRLPVR
jgi:hypothetical protein